MGLQPVASNTLGIGERRLHRQYTRGPHFGRLLHNEIRASLLNRRKHQPQIRRVGLCPGLLGTNQHTFAFCGLNHIPAPLAITPVEQQHSVANAQSHHPEKVMCLLPRQGNRLPRPKRVIYTEPDFCAFHESEHMTGTDGTPDTNETGQVADAVKGNWVDHYAPAPTRPYLRLARADRPIGTWLLLIPCFWAIGLASLMKGQFTTQHLWIAIGCSVGAWLMRGAGCTWNDITDREFDDKVERTRSRPIPSGQVTVRGAVIWMAAQALLALLILLTFHPLAVALGIGSLALIAIYPFAKRFTWWPQVFLGLAFNWGALLAFAAATGTVNWAAVLIYIGGIFWTLFYDTIYAHQDTEDDALIGVKSTARLFGDNTAKWLKWFMVGAVTFFAAGLILALGTTVNVLQLVVALGGIWAFGWHLAWQLRELDIDDPAKCLMLFRSNRNAGLIPVLFFAVAHFL